MWDKFSVHKRNMSPCLSWHDGPRWEHKLAGMFKFCAITEHWWGFSSTVCADDDVRRRQEAHSAPVCARFYLDLGTWIFTETLTWERFSAQLKAKNATSLFSSLLLSAKQPFVSDKSSNTPVSPARGGNQRAVQCLQNLLLSARAQSIPDHPGKFTACRLSTNKSAGQNERGVVMLTEAVEKAPSWAPNCFPPLHGAAL